MIKQTPAADIRNDVNDADPARVPDFRIRSVDREVAAHPATGRRSRDVLSNILATTGLACDSPPPVKSHRLWMIVAAWGH
jgi:hypothetical protein